MDITKSISKSDAILLLELISECVSCKKSADANKLISKLSNALNIDNAVYGLAKLNKYGSLVSYDIINVSYPEEWLDLYKKNDFYKIDPISKENFTNFKLQFWTDTYKKWDYPIEFISAAKDFNINNGYAFGVRNLKGTEGSIFSIAGKFKDHTRHRFILDNLTPHLHNAFNTVLSLSMNKASFDLSTREIEILNWIKQGKSTWDISAILTISERTVKFHVNNIMLKLDAVSRTHAVAIALSAGLIDIV